MQDYEKNHPRPKDQGLKQKWFRDAIKSTSENRKTKEVGHKTTESPMASLPKDTPSLSIKQKEWTKLVCRHLNDQKAKGNLKWDKNIKQWVEQEGFEDLNENEVQKFMSQ